MKTRTAYVVFGLLAIASLPLQAAQPSGDFPDRPVRMIVPFPPGGSNDVLGRYIGTKLTERIGQQFVIDNRGGANGIIGADLAAQSAPDGYTLLVISTSWVMNAAIRSLPYDVEKSFDPVATIGSAPNSIVVNSKGPFQSVRDIVEQAKARPGEISYASTGVGGFNHFGGELFKKVAGINLQMVPYKGGGPAMTDVMAGNIPIMFSSLTQVLPHVRAARLKVLAVGAEKRSPVVPEIPTIAESGFPGYEVSVWWGIAAPVGLPRAVMEALRRQIVAVIQDPETQKRLLADAAVPMNRTPTEMRKMIRADVKKWREVARVAGIKVK